MFYEKYWRTKAALSEGNQMKVDNDQCEKGENEVLGTNGQSSSFQNGFSSHMNILQSHENFGFW